MSAHGGSRKRLRVDPSKVYSNLVDWVVESSRSGYVHPNIRWIDSSRSLVARSAIDAGTLVLKVPVIRRESDAHLARYLAQKPPAIQPYLDCLPEYVDLPRLWSNSTLSKLLAGSPVLSHIKKIASETEPSLSYETAAVTSRAFCTPDGDPCMIPLLDLCDHCRGSGQKKNLSYCIDNDIASVTTTTDIQKGDELRITYGALSNSQLLVNYGFCIAGNTEPDGSSNDVYQFSESIALRTGPRAYTYGSFVLALESFRPVETAPANDEDESHAGSRERVCQDVMAFLDECDEEEKMSDSEDDSIDYSSENHGSQPRSSEESMSDCDLRSLDLFRDSILQRVSQYSLSRDDLTDQIKQSKKSREYFASLLIFSELRILQFFLGTICAIKQKLVGGEAVCTDPIVNLLPDDIAVLDSQKDELVDAYLRIRHPSL